MKKRLRLVRVSKALLAKLFTAGQVIGQAEVTVGLPEGAELVGLDNRDPFNVGFIFEYAGFQPVKEGEPIPVHEIEVASGEEEPG